MKSLRFVGVRALLFAALSVVVGPVLRADICSCGAVCPCRPSCPCPKTTPKPPTPPPSAPPSTPVEKVPPPSTSIPPPPVSANDHHREPPPVYHPKEPTGPSEPRFEGGEIIPNEPGEEVPGVVVVPMGTRPKTTENPLSTWTTSTAETKDPGTGYKLDTGLKLSASLSWDWEKQTKLSYGPPIIPAAPPPYNGPREVKIVDGWFEPSQGVWQDDKRFADAPGKRLRKTAPAVHQAELPMVKDRPALLYGIRDDNYTDVVIQYASQMATPVPVHFRFTLNQGGSTQVIYEEDPGLHTIHFDPPQTNEWVQDEVRLNAAFGLPRNGKGPGGKDYFTFSTPGPYIITAELYRDDNNSPTGIKTVVFGTTVETFAPAAQIMPVMLWPKSVDALREKDATALLAACDTLKTACEMQVPEWYPIKPGSFSLPVRGIRNLGTFVESYLADPDEAKWRTSLGPDADVQSTDHGFVPALLGSYFDMLARLGQMSRTIVVVSKADFLQQNIFVNKDTLQGAQTTLAYAACQKVMFAPSDSTSDTVAHELIHTLPYLWSASEMTALFGFSWHNKSMNVANGPQIFRSTRGGGFVVDRTRHSGAMCIMEAGSAGATYWIAQGMYWQLTQTLQRPPDPELMLISGFAAQKNGRESATIRRVYSLMGIADLQALPANAALPPGSWTIQTVDTAARVLSRYPFQPSWEHPEQGPPRVVVPLSYTIPADDRVSEIRVVGHGGAVLASRRLSFAAPDLAITTPANGAAVPLEPDGTLTVSWRATGSGGAPLVYSVFYSPDGGTHWFDQVFEQKGTTFRLKPEGGTANPLVRVIASDGTRSRTATVGFRIR